MITIAIDAMGGDHGPSVVVPAALLALKQLPKLHIILVGDEPVLRQHLQSLQASESPRLRIHHASQQVAMDESPSQALRSKKDSSMRVAINMVKQGQAQACVSAGNTGALVVMAHFVLKTLPGVDRPAISSALPTIQPGRKVRVLDLGANVNATAENLFQFAVMGTVLCQAVDNIPAPSVGLLNIGQEEIKGNEQVKQAAQLLINNPAIHYFGFVEGDKILRGVADIIVCDGFVGNVALKVTEGVAKFMFHYIKSAFSRNWLTKLAGLIAKPVLKSIRNTNDPARYNGASLLGLQGIVIKSHGGADILAYTNAIQEAVIEVERNVPERIRERVAALLVPGAKA